MNDVRDAIRDRLGSVPEDCDPAVEITAVESADGFERRRLEYAVEPGERVGAYLLVPDDCEAGDGGQNERENQCQHEHQHQHHRPGVLAIHQHDGEYALGKSEPAGIEGDPALDYGAALCRRGYVVCCPDLLCFEDRRPTAEDRADGTAPEGMRYERFEATDRLLRGSTLQAKYLSDLSVALDVLAGRDEVDAGALGAIGHSLGGQEALWLAWHDDRLAAAVSSCGAARVADIQRERIVHNFALYVPGFLEVGDVEDLLAGARPTPLFVTNGAADPLFPVESVLELADRTADAYAAAGVPERFESVVFQGGHGFPPDVRERAFEWLDRWLSV